ncbi:hypothetical protein ACHAWF_005007, partial [Thalassiosira exigua]
TKRRRAKTKTSRVGPSPSALSSSSRGRAIAGAHSVSEELRQAPTMANDASAKVAKAAAKGNGGGGSGTADARSRSGAGPTPYHRRSSYLPRDPKRAPKPPPPVAELARWRLRRVLCSWRFRWLVYDNSGSYNGWFDWLPLWMRVGPWNPFVGLTIAFLYAATFRFKPRPLEFAPFVLDGLEGDDGSDRIVGMPRATAVDLCIFVWCAVVMIQAKMSLGSIGFFPSELAPAFDPFSPDLDSMLMI